MIVFKLIFTTSYDCFAGEWVGKAPHATILWKFLVYDLDI